MTSGFTQGDDFVAARVSIDVPTEGLQTLREMSQGIDRFRTSVEAAARSSASFVGYVQQMTQAQNMASEAGRNLAAQLERNSELQMRAMGGGGASQQLPLSRSAPQGYVDNFSGMGAGMGGSGRSPMPLTANSPEVQQMANIDPTRQLDPRKYLNAQAGRYRTVGDLGSQSPGTIDWNDQANRVEERDRVQREQTGRSTIEGFAEGFGGGMGGGLARNIFNEMHPGGGSHLGMASAALRAAGGLSRRLSAAAQGSGTDTAIAAMQGGAPLAEETASANGLSGVVRGALPALGMLGRFAGPVGLGLAGVGALEKGGAMYQNYKNLGSIRGGGAGEGMDTEMSVRSLALNPFISNDQARQVIMAGLTEGYSGKSFDTVTKFMTDNLKEMNMSVSDSVKLLRNNVQEGGQSVEGLAASLATIKEASKTGMFTMPDRMKAFEEGSANQISMGASGAFASKTAAAGMNVWDDDPFMKGRFYGMETSAGSTAASGALLASMSGGGLPAGIPPDMLQAYMSANGGDMGDMVEKTMKNMIAKFIGNSQPKGPTAGQYFRGLRVMIPVMQQLFPGQQMDAQVAMKIIEKYRGGDPGYQGGKDKQEQIASQVSGGYGVAAQIGQGFGAFGNSVVDTFKMGLDLLHGDTEGAGRAWDNSQAGWDQADYNAKAQAQNPILNSLVEKFGPNSIEVGSGDNWGKLTGSKDQVEALAKGQTNWRRKGDSGAGYKLSESMGYESKDSGGGTSQTNVNFSPAQVQIKVDTTTGNTTVSPNPVRLTPNMQATNSGQGGASLNNPPPGDATGYIPGRSVGSH